MSASKTKLDFADEFTTQNIEFHMKNAVEIYKLGIEVDECFYITCARQIMSYHKIFRED
jgi:hypothetical protein